MSLRASLTGIVGFLLLAAGAAPIGALSARTLSARTLSGRVELVDRLGGRLDREADPSLAVVSFRPDAATPAGPGAPAEMVTRGKAFIPQVLAVTQGTTVRFPNSDPILHNVFSVSAGNRFDLGFLPRGPGGSWTFREPGIVRVFCNVHHAMVGYVLVLETPHFTSPDARGGFSLDGLDPAAGTLSVWHPRTELWSRRLQAGETAPVVVRLPVVRERVPPHLNKFGRTYRGRRDRYP